MNDREMNIVRYRMNRVIESKSGADLKNVTSRLIETGLFAQFSVAAEQMYSQYLATQGPRSSQEHIDNV